LLSLLREVNLRFSILKEVGRKAVCFA